MTLPPPPPVKATLTTNPAKPKVGDEVTLVFAFALYGGAPTFTLEGAAPVFEGSQESKFDFANSKVTWTWKAVKAGRASLLLKVIYETTYGCVDRPGFVFTGGQAGPFDVDVAT